MQCLENRKELNTLCNSLINYQITLEEVKGGQDSEDCSMVTTSTPNEIGECSSSSRSGATKSLSQSNSKPKPATSKGKAKVSN